MTHETLNKEIRELKREVERLRGGTARACPAPHSDWLPPCRTCGIGVLPQDIYCSEHEPLRGIPRG